MLKKNIKILTILNLLFALVFCVMHLIYHTFILIKTLFEDSLRNDSFMIGNLSGY